MEEQGRVVTLSQTSTYNIDNELASELEPIKQEFYKKQNASRYCISKLESTTAQV